MPEIADLTDEERDVIGAYKLDLIAHYDALAAEMEYLRDVVRGRRVLDDEPSPLDDFLGYAPPVRAEPVTFSDLDAEEEDEPVAEANPIDDLPSGTYATASADDGCVKRRITVLGRQLVAELEDDGWVNVVPSGDRMALPVLSGQYRNGKIDAVSCQLSPRETQQLVSAVEKLFSETFANRRAGGAATRSARSRRAG